MERRAFFQVGAVTGLAAALSGPSEALALFAPLPGGAVPIEPPSPFRTLDQALKGAMSDRRLAFGTTYWPVDTLDGEGERLVRQGIQALLMTGAFHDLLPEEQAHPEVRRALSEALPRLDATVRGHFRLLSRLTPEELHEAQEVLEEAPDRVMALAEMLDEGAAAHGVSLRRRLHLRRVMGHLEWRLKHQSLELLVSEVSEKARRMGLDADEEPEAASAALGADGGSAGESPPAPLEAGKQREPGERAYRVGARLMGIGLVTGAIGGFLSPLAMALPAGTLTLGVLLVLLGCILLSLSALIRRRHTTFYAGAMRQRDILSGLADRSLKRQMDQ